MVNILYILEKNVWSVEFGWSVPYKSIGQSGLIEYLKPVFPY